MESTGFVVKIDRMGKLVIPSELRRSMEIYNKDPVEIYVEQNKIILEKYKPGCIFCGDTKEIINYKNTFVCKNCIKDMEKNKNNTQE